MAASAWLAAPSPALAADSDADGIDDSIDAFPCDGAVSAISFAPAEAAHGTMVFEDLWPAAGDLDFNDVVLRYNYTFQRNAAGNVRRIRLVLNVSALGGDLSNGLGLVLPVSSGLVSSVTRQVGAGAVEVVPLSASDANATIVLSSNLRELFANATGRINSLSTVARSSGSAMVVEISFASAVSLSTGAAPYDLFIFRAGNRGHEIHRPEYRGTSSMTTALFGTADDRTTASRAFIDTSGLPFALVFPSAVSFPLEAVGISALFPNITTFASSGGVSATDFYVSNVVAANAYRDSTGQAAPSPTMGAYSIDTSCVPVGPTAVNLTANGAASTWTVPAGVSSVRFEAWGASGGRGVGGATGGLGAYAAGTFAVSAGQVITLAIGTAGGNGTYVVAGGGGGGGTFISRAGTPLLIAGGGGGGSYSGSTGGGHGLTTLTSGRGGYTSRVPTDGYGGYSDNTGGGGLGAGGGGWFGAGTGNAWLATGGAAAGGAGGPMYGTYGGFGGFGGGGGSMHGGGGGGGYTGGHGGSYSVGGGGGGSYNAGTSQTMTAGVNSGAGRVTITY